MKSIKTALTVLGIFTVVFVLASFVVGKSDSKIGFVRSNVLIYSFDGTKEAQVKFNKQKDSWQANLDTLKAEFNRDIASFNAEQGKLSSKLLQERRQGLISKEKQIQQYAQAIEEKAQQQDSEIMQAVLNQINSFTEAYAEEHGYDLILGTTESGSVLYGTKALDITDELLEALNKKYHGQ